MKKILLFVLVIVAAVLSIISVASAATYIVQPGDTLTRIAHNFSTTVGLIADENGIADINKIYAGRKLNIPAEERSFGAGLTGSNSGGYTPVTGYSSRTTQYVSASATTIPVSGTKDPSGNQIVLSNISASSTVKVYLNLEAGTTREEPIVCTGLTATSWTGCTRGFAFQGSSETSSSTIAVAHNAGSAIVISNIGQFYNQYVSIDGSQLVNNIKTFSSYPKFSTTTTVPTLGAEFATKYYVDNVGAGGFTAAKV